MTRKLKKVAQDLSKKTGTSYAGAINLLRKGHLNVGDRVEVQMDTTFSATIVHIFPEDSGLEKPSYRYLVSNCVANPLETDETGIRVPPREYLFEETKFNRRYLTRVPRAWLRRIPDDTPDLFQLFYPETLRRPLETDPVSDRIESALPVFRRDGGSIFYAGSEYITAMSGGTERFKPFILPTFEVRADLVFENTILCQDLPCVQYCLEDRMKALFDAAKYAACEGYQEQSEGLQPSDCSWFMPIHDGNIVFTLLKKPPVSGPYVGGLPFPGVKVFQPPYHYGLMLRESRIRHFGV